MQTIVKIGSVVLNRKIVAKSRDESARIILESEKLEYSKRYIAAI